MQISQLRCARVLLTDPTHSGSISLGRFVAMITTWNKVAVSQPKKRKSDSTEALIEKLRDYEVLKVLGRGGMGIVFLVRHTLTKRVEALKVLRPSLASRLRTRERFLREVQVAAKLDHPNVVKTLTAIQTDGVLGLVMEYVEGQDLESWVRTSGPLSVAAAASVIGQAALGLQHAADCGLTHRDIKPSNILVTRINGNLMAKLSDFGLSKIDDDPSNNNLTTDGRLLGTPDYMAPEQGLDAASSTVAADIYGLGCTLFYALTGRPPYTAPNPLSVLKMHIQAPIPDASHLRNDIPVGLNFAITKMLQKEPRSRYLSPADVAKAVLPFASPTHADGSPAISGLKTVSQVEPAPADSPINDSDERQRLVFRSPTRPVRRTQKSRGGNRVFSLGVQIALPIILVLFIVFVLKPSNQTGSNADGTLLIKELAAGTSIDIDGTIKVAADKIDKQVREIRLSPGLHKLKVLDTDTVITERTVNVKSNSTVEFALSYMRAPKKKARSPSSDVVDHPKETSSSSPLANSLNDTPASQPNLPEIAPTPMPTPGTTQQANNGLAAPCTVLLSSDWSLEVERQLSGLDSNPSSLMILPRNLTAQGGEVVAALGSSPKAWEARTGFPQPFVLPFAVSGLELAGNEKSVLYFDDHRCEVWTVTKPKPVKWFWTPEVSDVNRVFAMSTDSRYLACVDFNEAYIGGTYQRSLSLRK